MSFECYNSKFNEETLKVIEEDNNENVFGIYDNFDDFVEDMNTL